MAKLFGANSDRKLPFVSVVMPAYNEEECLAQTLETVIAQDYAGRFEIVVCDNNSKDRTSEIAASYGCRVILETRKGSRFAYQTAMDEAKGDPILVTNADVVLPTNWISAIVQAYLDDPEVIGVGTRIKFHDAPGYVNFFLRNIHYRFHSDEAFWGLSMSSTREAFEKVGGINHGYNTNEDAIFSLLLKKFGKIKVLKEPVVSTSGRRFAGNPVKAAWNWFRGIGFNSIYIMLQYSLTGRIKGLVIDFKDVRPEEKLTNKYRLLQTDETMLGRQLQKLLDYQKQFQDNVLESVDKVNKNITKSVKRVGQDMKTSFRRVNSSVRKSVKTVNQTLKDTLAELE